MLLSSVQAFSSPFFFKHPSFKLKHSLQRFLPLPWWSMAVNSASDGTNWVVKSCFNKKKEMIFETDCSWLFFPLFHFVSRCRHSADTRWDMPFPSFCFAVRQSSTSKKKDPAFGGEMGTSKTSSSYWFLQAVFQSPLFPYCSRIDLLLNSTSSL